MQRIVLCGLALCGLAGLCGADWTQFRGAGTTSVAEGEAPPVTWSDTENIAWKAGLPGRGLSGPIVVKGRVYVTASSGYRQDRLHVLCFDVTSGEQLWERQFWATGRTMCHQKMANATPQPASDGERVFAFYSSNDLACLDLDGNLQWFRGLTHDYPNASNSLGMASSPVVIGKSLVVMVENDSDSLTFGIDTENGLETWKLNRPKLPNWTSPAILHTNSPAGDLALIQSGEGLNAIEPATGKTVWKFAQGCANIPSATVAGETIFVPCNGLTALRHESGSANPTLLWQENSLNPGTASPVAYRGRVYTANRAGVLTCADVKDGQSKWKLRLTGPFTATPIAAGDYMYLFNEEGSGQVVKLGDEAGEIAGTNALGETILATPAIADGALYVRSHGHLWKIARK